MKKQLKFGVLMWLIILVVQGKCIAQEGYPKNVFKVGVGFLPSQRSNDLAEDVMAGFFNSLTAPFGGSPTSIENRKYSPALSMTFSSMVSKSVILGINGTYLYSSGDLKTGNKIAGHYNRHFFSVSGEGEFIYYSSENFAWFGLLGLGYCWSKPQAEVPDEWHDRFMEKRNNFTMQVSPIGFRTGKKVGFSLAFGYGYKGIFNSAVDFRF